LTLPAFAVVLAFGIITTIALRASAKYTSRQAALAGDRSALVLQMIQGIAKIRVAGAVATMFERWAELMSDGQRAQVKAATRTNVTLVAAGALGLATSTAVYLVAIAQGDAIPLARFVVFASALSIAIAAVASLALVATQSVQVSVLVQRAQPILKTPTEDLEGGRAVELSGAISFRDLHFQYSPESPMVLNDFTLEVPAGSFTALVGASGSGKSTALRCFLGFEKPQRGSIFVDDFDLKELDPILVRRQLGVVMQRFSLIGGSIQDNIIGGRDLTLDDAWRAAELVGLADFIRSLPMGMHTYLVDGGGTLSGGQIQRLLLARSIAGNPRIIILDEATSALDNPTQQAVTESFARMKVTRLVVAHRLSTVRDADQIAVVVRGHVDELGTHDELMSKNGRYAELIRRQI
jgi:ABC-type bacteriocin/lantibiotic exporter with double-glycine peptidase domain